MYHFNIRSIFLVGILSICILNTAEAQENESTSKSEEEIFTSADETPLFPGGEKAMFEFLAKSVRYPTAAKENGIEGIVVISFVVEIDGSLSNLKVVRGIGTECDEESMRVIRTMPKWTPGKRKGESVRILYNLPFRFILQNGKRKKKKKGKL